MVLKLMGSGGGFGVVVMKWRVSDGAGGVGDGE